MWVSSRPNLDSTVAAMRARLPQGPIDLFDRFGDVCSGVWIAWRKAALYLVGAQFNAASVAMHD
jgi:hypothetical protein